MNEVIEALERARSILGSYAAMGAICGVSGKAVEKWQKRGKMPRTEYTGETRYSEMLAEATKDAVKAAELRPDVILGQCRCEPREEASGRGNA